MEFANDIPTIVLYLIPAGIFLFITTIILSVKSFRKLRKEELSYLKKITTIEIKEPYEEWEMITYTPPKKTTHISKGYQPLKNLDLAAHFNFYDTQNSY